MRGQCRAVCRQRLGSGACLKAWHSCCQWRCMHFCIVRNGLRRVLTSRMRATPCLLGRWCPVGQGTPQCKCPSQCTRCREQYPNGKCPCWTGAWKWGWARRLVGGYLRQPWLCPRVRWHVQRVTICRQQRDPCRIRDLSYYHPKPNTRFCRTAGHFEYITMKVTMQAWQSGGRPLPAHSWVAAAMLGGPGGDRQLCARSNHQLSR